MGRLAADLAETFKEGQGGRPGQCQAGDLLPSGHPSSPLPIVDEWFCRNVEFLLKGVDMSMLFAEILSNLEKLPVLVNCKSYRLSQRLVVVIHDSAAILTPVFESSMTMRWVLTGSQAGTVVSEPILDLG